MKMSPVIWTLAAFSLSACQSSQTNSGCPPLIEYSVQTQKKAAEELRRLPKESVLAQFIVDYKKTRDACRLGG